MENPAPYDMLQHTYNVRRQANWQQLGIIIVCLTILQQGWKFIESKQFFLLSFSCLR